MSSRIRKAVAHKRKHNVVNVDKSLLAHASRVTKNTIASTQMLFASVENSITLGNLGSIDNAEMESLKFELRRSSFWLKELEQTATKYLSFLTMDWKPPPFLTYSSLGLKI